MPNRAARNIEQPANPVPGGTDNNRLPELNRDLWRAQIESELRFWTRALSSESPDLDKMTANARTIGRNLLPALIDNLKILDVGSGPFPIAVDNSSTTIDAADPLAVEYTGLLERHSLPVSGRFVATEGETLTSHFEPASYDFVIANRCLDQCYDPTAFVESMRQVCRPGGKLIFAVNNVWDPSNAQRSPRNWNMIVVNDDLILWRGEQSFSLRTLVGETSEFELLQPSTGEAVIRIMPVSSKNVAKPDYAKIYNAVYSTTKTYTASHASPGLRTALAHADKLMACGPNHLDVGAGPGYLVEVMAMPPFRKTSFGVDISSVAVEMADQRIGAGRVRVIEQGKFSFPDTGFDLITCFDVLEHLEPVDVERLMGEIRRVAKPGALGLFNISLRDSSVRDINGDSVHRTIYSAEQWDRLIGFDSYTVWKQESELLAEVRF